MKEGFVVFGLLPLAAVLVGIAIGMYSTSEDEKVHTKMNAVCAPFYFVEQERAADYLIRVKCLSERGENKEILIKENAK